MLGRNEYLQFTKADVDYIKGILQDFALIAEKMGFKITTGTELSSDKEALELWYCPGGGKKMAQVHRKSIVATWQVTVEKIRSELFGELKRLCKENNDLTKN